MKVKDLVLGQKVIINSFEYVYKGVMKVRLKGIGAVQKVVFKSQKPEIEDKLFDLNVLNSEIKKLNIEIL